MKGKIIVSILALFSLIAILCIGSSFGIAFIPEGPEGCAGDPCLRGYNPNTQDSVYYQTKFSSPPEPYICCGQECEPDFQGCQAKVEDEN